MALGFGYSATFTCGPACPMLIPVSTEGQINGLDYSLCLCNINGTLLNATGYVDTTPPIPDSFTVEQQRYNTISAATGISGSTGQNCYICASASSPVVYEACPDFAVCNIPGILGFRPANINSTMRCNTQTPPSGIPLPYANALQSPAITNRALVNIMIWVTSALFAVQAICALTIAYAYYRFKDKYDSDWGRLSSSEIQLGVLAKLLPNIARVANLVSLIFLALASKYLFSDRVCQYDQNSQGYVVFYPTLYGYLIAMIFVWLFFCVLGGCFHNTYPRDTSFYNPRFPEEPSGNVCVKLLCRGWCILTNFGP